MENMFHCLDWSLFKNNNTIINMKNNHINNSTIIDQLHFNKIIKHFNNWHQ